MNEETAPYRWSRSDWWGVVVDAPDVAELARFYSELLGWKIHKLTPTWVTLDPGEGVASLAFQFNADYVRPVWPTVKGQQQAMLHLDFETTDLDASAKRAIALGATLAEFQPQPNVRVLLDPAGHPFCFYI